MKIEVLHSSLTMKILTKMIKFETRDTYHNLMKHQNIVVKISDISIFQVMLMMERNIGKIIFETRTTDVETMTSKAFKVPKTNQTTFHKDTLEFTKKCINVAKEVANKVSVTEAMKYIPMTRYCDVIFSVSGYDILSILKHNEMARLINNTDNETNPLLKDKESITIEDIIAFKVSEYIYHINNRDSKQYGFLCKSVNILDSTELDSTEAIVQGNHSICEKMSLCDYVSIMENTNFTVSRQPLKMLKYPTIKESNGYGKELTKKVNELLKEAGDIYKVLENNRACYGVILPCCETKVTISATIAYIKTLTLLNESPSVLMEETIYKILEKFIHEINTKMGCMLL